MKIIQAQQNKNEGWLAASAVANFSTGMSLTGSNLDPPKNQSKIELKINTLKTMISYSFKFNNFDQIESSALLIDALVKKNYLTSSTIYPTICHVERENKKFYKYLIIE